MTQFGLVLKNLFRKKLRTFLTVFAILIAFLLYGVLSAFGSALLDPPPGPAQTRLVATNKVNFTQPLPISYIDKIRQQDNVKFASHASWFGGYYQEERNFMIAFAVDPETYLDAYSEFTYSPGAREAFLKDRTGIMVGKKYADQFGWKVGDKIPVKSNIWRKTDGSNTWEFTVSGIFTDSTELGGDGVVFFHYDYYNEGKAFAKDLIGQVIIVTKDVSKNDATAQAIDNMFINTQAETETRSEAAFAQSFTGQLGDIGFIITAVVGAAFITILLIAANTMMLTVRERTGEIGVLKTMGFTSQRIFGMVLSESMIMAFIGGLLGLGLAVLAIGFLNSLGLPFGTIKIKPSLLISSVALMAGLGLLTGGLPAWRAMQTNIVTAFGRK